MLVPNSASEVTVIKKIISGGQTGADRAALDWAIKHGVQHGGWCPAGRGQRMEQYLSVILCRKRPRTDTSNAHDGTRDSNATLIISLSSELTGGSLTTQEWANKMNRPCLHVYPCSDWRSRLRIFTETHPIGVLNVAGPRLSGARNIEQFVGEVLDEMLIYCDCHSRI